MAAGKFRSAAAVFSAVVAMSGLARAAEPTTQEMADQLHDLQRKVNQLEAKDTVLPATTQPVTGLPTATPGLGAPGQNPFSTVFVENKPIVLPGDFKAGYHDGFYIQQGDDFNIQFNGLIDLRYTFEQAKNKTTLKTTALGADHIQDLSGFNLFNGELSVQGTIYKNVFFKMMGNFGSLSTPSSPQAGAFEINELYAGYRFAPELQVRGGSLIVPFTPLRSTTNYGGLMFPDLSDAAIPFLPGYALGVDVLGAVAGNTISYDLMISNGSNSQNLIDSTLPNGGRDNRLAVYTREQFVGSGKLSDFTEESDLQNHAKLVWRVGGGFGYESQNTTATAFPGAQTSLGVSGLSSATGQGFAAKYNVNGQIERYAADFNTKYKGWAVFGEAYYQHLQSNGGPIEAGYTKSSIGQVGYFIESGYFVIPQKLELAARFGQLYTNGLPHEMDEYELGLNYYPLGENLKIQVGETYVPRQAALTSNNGIIQNTQDWETQIQLQLKF